MKMEQTVCSETLAFKLQTPGNHPEESKQQFPLPHYYFHTDEEPQKEVSKGGKLVTRISAVKG
jgi:hypothetical protein